MGRSKIHKTNADRQRAYRGRLAAQPPITQQPQRPRRQASRPMRLARAKAIILELFDEYEDWHASMPENLQESEQAHRLSETVDHLAAIIDILSEIEPPRGFGRD